MSKENGFLQLRRGVFEHVKDGRMSHMDALAFIYIVAQADTRTGVWKGSASSLAGDLGMSPRTARDVLERLSARGYLRRFPVPGKHSCYPILVHKFLLTDGEHRGEHLNARESTSKDNLRYFPREQRVEDYGGHGVEHGAAQKKIENREQRSWKKNRAAKTAPPADPRHKPFFDSAYEAFRLKHDQPPTWAGKEARALQGFLKEHGHITLEEWQGRFGNFLASTESFIRKQGCSLAYFVAHFDTFKDGPILEKVSAGRGNEHRQRTREDSLMRTGAALFGGQRPS